MLPLISKSWARVLGGPSLAWDCASLSVHIQLPPPNPMAMLKWFTRRQGCGPASSVAGVMASPFLHVLYSHFCTCTSCLCPLIVLPCRVAFCRRVRDLVIQWFGAQDMPGSVIGAILMTQVASLQCVDVEPGNQFFTGREAAALVSAWSGTGTQLATCDDVFRESPLVTRNTLHSQLIAAAHELI